MREGIGTLLRTSLCILLLPACLILYSAAACVFALLGAPRRRIDWFYHSFGRVCLRVGGTELEVHGRDHVDPGQAYIVVPNHESNWDPPSLMAALAPLSVRFIAKRQIMAIPIFGHALRLTGNVRVVRTNTARDVESIREKMAERPREVSVLFYAEGTRSRDGAFHAFKKGAFATAIADGIPILPVAQAGCFRIWAPETVRLRKGGVNIEIGEPIPVDGLELEHRDELRDRTHEVVKKLRERARQRLRDRGWDPGGID
jgi:1-acyl-sn-glycerol-3-phosphate acyltransferase